MLGDFNLAFSREQRNAAHLLQVDANRVLFTFYKSGGFFLLAFGRLFIGLRFQRGSIFVIIILVIQLIEIIKIIFHGLAPFINLRFSLSKELRSVASSGSFASAARFLSSKLL